MATVKGDTLTVNGKEYKIRYTTPHKNPHKIICNTDELQGEFGDEFPISKISNQKNRYGF